MPLERAAQALRSDCPSRFQKEPEKAKGADTGPHKRWEFAPQGRRQPASLLRRKATEDSHDRREDAQNLRGTLSSPRWSPRWSKQSHFRHCEELSIQPQEKRFFGGSERVCIGTKIHGKCSVTTHVTKGQKSSNSLSFRRYSYHSRSLPPSSQCGRGNA